MKKIFIFLAGLLLLGSCDLDLQPENGLTYSNSFDTERELNTTTSAIQFYLLSSVADNLAFRSVGVLADELQSGQEVRRWNPQYVNGVQDWSGLYKTIFESHLLLDNISRTKNLNEERYNTHAGQAHFALGLAYLCLVQRYGEVPILEDSKTIKVYDASSQLAVLDHAIVHASKALELLPTYDKLKDVNGAAITNRQYASKGSSAALLAHLYAWKGSVIELYKFAGDAREAYRKSVEYATMLIDQQVGHYQLAENPEELCTGAFNKASTSHPEVVFSLIYDVGRSIYAQTPNFVASEFLSYPVDETALLGDIESKTILRLYKSTIDEMYEETDLRKQAFFYEVNTEHSSGTKTYALAYKFRNAIYDVDQTETSGKRLRSLDTDYVYWRLADIYLLRAECAAKLGEGMQAQNDLNVIRRRAQATEYPNAKKDSDGLQRAIFREREKEFICENDARFFDIIRNNYFRTDLEGKFKTLTHQDVLNGALVLPVPQEARYKDGILINPVIRQKIYWAQYIN